MSVPCLCCRRRRRRRRFSCGAPLQAIVNLQKTPKDRRAGIVIRAKIDAVMRLVMEELRIPIPVQFGTTTVCSLDKNKDRRERCPRTVRSRKKVLLVLVLSFEVCMTLQCVCVFLRARPAAERDAREKCVDTTLIFIGREDLREDLLVHLPRWFFVAQSGYYRIPLNLDIR